LPVENEAVEEMEIALEVLWQVAYTEGQEDLAKSLIISEASLLSLFLRVILPDAALALSGTAVRLPEARGIQEKVGRLKQLCSLILVFSLKIVAGNNPQALAL